MLRIGIALFVIATIVAGTLWKSDLAEAWKLGTTHQPERFTELAFINPRNLPKDLTPGKNVTFSYYVANHEAKTVNYHARVSIVENGKVRLLEQDEFTLTDEAAQDHIIYFSTDKPGTNVEIIVDLPEQAESIHFRSKS